MFENTEQAFKHKTTQELKKGALLFKSFNYPILIKWGPKLAVSFLKLGLPIRKLLKTTIFSWFCGGESIEECEPTIQILATNKVGTILDYSVEGEENDLSKDHTCQEIIDTIHQAAKNPNIPFCVFKTTGIVNPNILEKLGQRIQLNERENESLINFQSRFEKICRTAAELDVRIFVDAEESYYQDAIDEITYQMMAKYNTKKAIIHNTIQLYRHDRLAHLIQLFESTSYYLGFKLVRGAYLEKENEKARKEGYLTPMQPNKIATDTDFDAALSLCIQHIDRVSVCAGTHNAESCKTLTELMQQNNITKSDERIWFAQLMGMSDNISFNLANLGYNVAKYVPYGPLISMMPYLSRRAEENSSIAGQMSRELSLIQDELRRRKQL